jgi:hypothetical protein
LPSSGRAVEYTGDPRPYNPIWRAGFLREGGSGRAPRAERKKNR